MIEVVYTWPDGREEVRYRRPPGSELEREVKALQSKHGINCPYSLREAESERASEEAHARDVARRQSETAAEPK